jgi:hypothetical protein
VIGVGGYGGEREMGGGLDYDERVEGEWEVIQGMVGKGQVIQGFRPIQPLW